MFRALAFHLMSMALLMVETRPRYVNCVNQLAEVRLIHRILVANMVVGEVLSILSIPD